MYTKFLAAINPKLYFLERGWSLVTFKVTFKVVQSYNFSENFTEIEAVQKIWRYSSSILTSFVNSLDFLTFPCYKKNTNDVGK